MTAAHVSETAMNPLLSFTVALVLLVPFQVAAQEEERAQRLEDARAAVEARLTRSTLKDVNVTAADVKRVRRITIGVAPFNKNPRDDASSALTAAWQPALQHLKSFDEIAVRVGPNYSVTCSARALADTTISLWGERLTRTCREQRSARK